MSLRYSADFRRSRLVSFSVDNLTLNGPLFLQSLFICSTNFLRSRFDSRTKPQIFYASKSRCETKGFFVWFFCLVFFCFVSFRHYATFLKLFGFYQRVDYFKKILFPKKNFKNNFFEEKKIFANVSNSCSLNIFEP